ncbi:MAG: diguanylate cyclase [Schwartzia sp.]|nr:diguanylate cyclase [Schwartzia sp. (in: firmicutes)]
MNCWVVIVDDEMVSLTNAKTILAAEGMRVSRLRSGRDLLAFMAKNTPDLILLDIMMPEMDGFQTFRSLRQFEEETGRKQTPVIFLTGAEDSETEQRGLEEGASDFIRKPFNKDILIRRIYNTVTNAKTIENLMDEASVDKLTGLWNRAAGTKRIEELCATKDGTLLIMDLDNFKLVNDLYGHEMGDGVLKTFASVMRLNTREGDVVARIGGDEFSAFLFSLKDEAGLASLASRLNKQFMEETTKLMGGTLDIPLGISMGAAMTPEHGRDYETIFPLADSALYRAKYNGKHGYVLYSPEQGAEISPEENLQGEMERITQIVEERSDKDGALFLGFDRFSAIYRFVKRHSQRCGGQACKILFMLSGVDGEALKEAAKQFGECLQKNLQRSDVILQNKTNQFFLLLPDMAKSDVPAVTERIMKAWEASPHDGSVRIDYTMTPIMYGKKEN